MLSEGHLRGENVRFTAIGGVVCTSFDAVAWGRLLLLCVANGVLGLVLDVLYDN